MEDSPLSANWSILRKGRR